MPWRRIEVSQLEHEPRVRLRLEQAGQVVGAADGVDHPVGRARGVGRRAWKGRQGVSTSRSPANAVGDLGQLLVGADREDVDARPPSHSAFRASRPRVKP